MFWFSIYDIYHYEFIKCDDKQPILNELLYNAWMCYVSSHLPVAGRAHPSGLNPFHSSDVGLIALPPPWSYSNQSSLSHILTVG